MMIARRKGAKRVRFENPLDVKLMANTAVLGCLEIEKEPRLCRQLHWHVSGLFTRTTYSAMKKWVASSSTP
jgi:hypothetical protein